MMDREKLEQQLTELPLYVYTYIDPGRLGSPTGSKSPLWR